MFKNTINSIPSLGDIKTADAHCDGPCGIYDPATARITGEAVRSMTKKILALVPPDASDAAAQARYINTLSRYVAIKEEQAELTKHELLVLWTDFFKPEHLEANPDLHDTFWKAAKLCSACKVEELGSRARGGLFTFLELNDFIPKDFSLGYSKQDVCVRGL